MKTITTALLLLVAQTTFAADHEKALKDFLTDDVVAVAYVDLTSIDTLGLLEWAGKFGIVSTEQRGDAVQAAAAMQARLDGLVDSGVGHVYLLFRTSDISHGGPTWVVPITNSGKVKAVLTMIETWQSIVQSPALPEYWEASENALLAGTSSKQIEQLKASRPSAPRDLSEAWQSLGNGDIGLLVFGDRDSRRVIKEMLPTLPRAFRSPQWPVDCRGPAVGRGNVKHAS